MNALVVNGQRERFKAEAEFVSTLLSHGEFKVTSLCGTNVKHRARLPRELRKEWSLIWFAGHTVIYTRKNRGVLGVQDGRAFRHLCEADDLSNVKTKLLVLSACNTAHSSFPIRYDAPSVVVHVGTAYAQDSLVFAARFLSEMLLYRNPVHRANVSMAFDEAVAAVKPSGDKGWRLL